MDRLRVRSMAIKCNNVIMNSWKEFVWTVPSVLFSIYNIKWYFFIIGAMLVTSESSEVITLGLSYLKELIGEFAFGGRG